MKGVHNHIQRRRLTRAYQTISVPRYANEQIGTIALPYRFTNDTVFGRSFRSAYAKYPSEMR